MTSSLQELSISGQVCFDLDLQHATPLKIETIVRRVPGKRLVCRGMWNRQHVYAKIFIGGNAERYAERDKHGIRLLQQSNIRTPDLIHAGFLTNQPGMILIFAEIDECMNAEQAYQMLLPESKLKLAYSLVAEVARHHQAGLVQTDMYLKNFLVQNGTIYTLDGDGIRRLSSIFQRRQRLRNLATFLSKMDVLDDGWIPELYAHYCKQLNDGCLPADQAAIWRLTQKIRRQMAVAYADKKVFRSCTDVKVSQSFRRFVAVASDFELGDFTFELLDSKLADVKANLKNGNTCTVAKAMIADQQIVIKRYNIKSIWHGMNRAIRISRAARSWASTYRLMILGVATHKPLALFEARLACFRRRAYFLSEYIDAPDAQQYFLQCTNLAEKKDVAHELAKLFYKLYLLRITHGDCKASNIKIVGGAPALIDLDAMKAHSLHRLADARFKFHHVKDLKRLLKNWLEDAEFSELLKQAFVQQYLKRHPYETDDILTRAGMR